MHNYCKTIGALAAASALVAGNAQAEVEYELHTGYSSEYVFRGVDQGDHLVEVGVDAAYEWNGLSLSAGVWASAYDNARVITTNQIDSETDIYGQVSKDLGFATASIGYIYYWEAGKLGVDNQEVYFSLSRDFGFANAYLTYFWDVVNNPLSATGQGGGNDGYTELGLSRKFEINQCLAVNVGTNIGYLFEANEFTSWTTKASLDWGFAERAKLSPFVAVAVGLGESNGTIWQSTDNELYAGSMLSVSF
jgi:uncharacterized protein (TIGR02001 family)